jgi:hypothetical protein
MLKESLVIPGTSAKTMKVELGDLSSRKEQAGK